MPFLIALVCADLLFWSRALVLSDTRGTPTFFVLLAALNGFLDVPLIIFVSIYLFIFGARRCGDWAAHVRRRVCACWVLLH